MQENVQESQKTKCRSTSILQKKYMPILALVGIQYWLGSLEKNMPAHKVGHNWMFNKSEIAGGLNMEKLKTAIKI